MIPIARPLMGEEERQAVLAVLDSGQLAAGPQVALFEADFARYVGLKYGIATCNGTASLQAALWAAGVRPGDVVATTAFSFVASANAIVFCGAEPLFVDIDPDTFNLSPQALEEALDAHPQVKAVLVVHLFGLPADMQAIGRLCAERGVVVVEDCAQAHGAQVHGKKVGSFGIAGSFSFYATKNMTTGEGGMVVTDSEEVAERTRRFVNHGRADRYLHEELGHNFRMTDLQAALGRVQLGRLEGWNEQRRANARFLDEGLADLPWVRTPVAPPGYRHVYHQYTVRTPHRDALIEWLGSRGIGCQVIYPLPLHQQPFYARRRQGDLRLPEAERAAQEVVSLPVHPALSQEDLARVVEAVRSFPVPAP